jgi:hypothetical protein
MYCARITFLTLLLAGGFALTTPSTANAQDPIPKKPDLQLVRNYLENPVRNVGIPKNELKQAQAAFNAFAKYIADVIAHPAMWKATQDFKPEVPVNFPYPSLEGPVGLFRELDRFVLEPVTGGTKVGGDHADYIRELGLALDTALKNLIETHPEQIVKINACRTLAHVARSGAPAHYETLAKLIADPKTPTHVKYYAFQAAAALLAAGDAADIKIRKHSGEPNAVGALVKALQDCVTDPALILPGFQADTATADQLAVLGFVRRQAVKALAQVKFATLPGPDGKTPIYPAFTLVRVALKDPALVPAPGPAECAETVIGLCNMQPPAKGYNADIAIEAVANALYTWAAPRAANPGDRTLPWRTYSLRLAEALRGWRPLFDPGFDVLQPNKFDPTHVPKALEEMYKEVVPKVLAQIDKVTFEGKPDTTVTVEADLLRQRARAMRDNPNRKKTLFEGVPETSVEFKQPK